MLIYCWDSSGSLLSWYLQYNLSCISRSLLNGNSQLQSQCPLLPVYLVLICLPDYCLVVLPIFPFSFWQSDFILTRIEVTAGTSGFCWDFPLPCTKWLFIQIVCWLYLSSNWLGYLSCKGLSFLGAFPKRSLVNVFWWSSWSYISDFSLCSWSLSEKNNILRCGFSLQQLHGIICIPTNAFILIN